MLSLSNLLDNEEQAPIEVGLVNLDQSDETALLVDLLSESSELGETIQMTPISEQQGKTGIETNQLSSYIIFPAAFFSSLMDGKQSQVEIIGNPDRPLQSQLINELMETITRHIRSSQASILTINDYAKQLGMDQQDRNDMLFEEFVDFFFYVLGSNKVVDEEQLINQATATPFDYFSLAGWFTLVTIWLLMIYTALRRVNDKKLITRMRLYGVTNLQQSIAHLVVTLLVLLILATMIFSGLLFFLDTITLTAENYSRVILLTALHSTIFLQSLILLDWFIQSEKLTLLIHTFFTILVVISSGALIPMIYFPVYLERLFSFSFAYQAFYWIERISLNGRFYAEYQALLLTMLAGFLLLATIAFVKERVQQ